MAVYRKTVAKFAYSDSLVKDVDIGNTEFLRKLELEFNGTLTATGGTGDGSLKEDGLLKTIGKALDITANGSDKHVNTDAVGEYFRRAIMSGSPGVLVSTMPTGAAATSQRVHVVIDMDQLQTSAKFAGRVAAARLADLVLRLTTGVCETDMVTGGDRTETLTGTFEIVGVFDSDPRGYRGGGRRITKQRLPVTAANDRARITIPSGLLVGDVLLVVVDNGVRNNVLLDTLKFQIGERDVRFETSFEDLQSDNVERFGLELSSGAPPYTGIALVHFDEDGDMSPRKLFNTVGLRVEGGRLEMNVGSPTGTSYVDVYTYAVDPAGVGR